VYGWITHRIWARRTEFGVAGVGKRMGGWAGIGTKVRRWMVKGIKGLRAQSDRMLSIGDGQTHVGVLKVCPKKEKMLGVWTELSDGWTDEVWSCRSWQTDRWVGRRWVVIGIMGLQAQSDGMLSLGAEWNMYGICPKRKFAD